MFSIIPEPKICTFKNKGSFAFDQNTRIIGGGFCAVATKCFISFINTELGYSLVECTETISNSVTLCIDKKQKIEREGYILDIDELSIKITAGSSAGLLYGYQTLIQIVRQCKNAIPLALISDSPRFSMRGFMLDVGRYFFNVSEVKHFIDIMVGMKLNTFHWHLSEDQGWRVEIKKYPKLTELGSTRSHTNFNRKPHGGFYTCDDIREVVSYAHARNIIVIPEIDMPGHMQAAISAYPELGCFDRLLPVATHWGVKHDILCGAKPEAMEFVKGVLDEIMQLFPDGYIHLGGDEAVKTRWKLCPKCQAKIKEMGLKNEDELQSVFMNEVTKYVEANNFKTITWSEEHQNSITDKNVIWQFYQNNPAKPLDPIIAAEANAGREIINVFSGAYYLDLPHGTIPLKATYEYEPMLSDISDKTRMKGVECCLWTEYVPNVRVAMLRLFPRILAFVETAWSAAENKNYEKFVAKLDTEFYADMKRYGFKLTTMAKANPKGVDKLLQNAVWGMRPIHWAGLHNAIDNAKVKRLVKKRK